MGEDFSILDGTMQAPLEAMPQIPDDPDLKANSQGVTIIGLM